jgi:hypothetical protein
VARVFTNFSGPGGFGTAEVTIDDEGYFYEPGVGYVHYRTHHIRGSEKVGSDSEIRFKVADEDPERIRVRDRIANILRRGASSHRGEAENAFRMGLDALEKYGSILTTADICMLSELTEECKQQFKKQHGGW